MFHSQSVSMNSRILFRSPFGKRFCAMNSRSSASCMSTFSSRIFELISSCPTVPATHSVGSPSVRNRRLHQAALLTDDHSKEHGREDLADDGDDDFAVAPRLDVKDELRAQQDRDAPPECEEVCKQQTRRRQARRDETTQSARVLLTLHEDVSVWLTRHASCLRRVGLRTGRVCRWELAVHPAVRIVADQKPDTGDHVAGEHRHG